MSAIPWIVGLAATALVAMSKQSKAATNNGGKVSPVVDLDKSAGLPVFSNQPVGGGVEIKPLPRTQLPPLIPRDAVPIDDDELEELEELPDFDAVSPGLPIGGKIPAKIIPVPDFPVPDFTDIGELEPIIVDVPGFDIPDNLGGIDIPQVIDLDDIDDLPPDAVPIAPPRFESDDPTELAVRVYGITQGPIRNLKGSEVTAIKAYQRDEGIKVDGFYGTETAESLIKYGFVPSTPWIWSKPISEDKADWNELVTEMAERDPQRAEEWDRAAV